MSLIERARHLTRPRSATATNRKVANHVGPPENGILYADSAQLALYAAKDGSFVLDKLSSSDGSQVNSARRIWERIPETYEHFKGPRSGWIGNNSSDPRDGWTKRPSSAYETDPEVVEAPAADRSHTQRDVDVKIGPTLCSEFTVAVADFTLSVNEMKAIVDSELNKGVSAVRGAVTQAMAEISDSVGKIKTPNDVLPEIQAELLRLHRETQIGFESRVLKEIRQANADSRAEIQEMKSLLEQSLDATATLTSQNNHYDVSATEINLKATTNIQNTVGIISDNPSPVPIMDLDRLVAQIAKLITDMKEAIVLQGYRNCMPLTNQVTALQESIAAQNERASADTTRLLQAIAKIDRYNVDLNPVLDTLNQGLARLERTRAPPESAPPESADWALKFATLEKAMKSMSQPNPIAPENPHTHIPQELLASCLERQQARSTRLASLPGARVQLTAPLDEALPSSVSNLEELRRVVARVASAFGVQAADIDVDVSAGTLKCDVCLKNKGTSVRAVVEAMKRDLDEPDNQSEIKKSLACVGASTKTGIIQIGPKWPLERIQAEIDLQCGYTVTLQDLEQLVSNVSASFEAYSNAWNQVRGKSKHAVDRLTQKESMASFADPKATSQFGDTLLSYAEGKRRSLQENWVVQESSKLPDVMQDAAKAQQQLKLSVAPTTEWGRQVLNDPTDVPYSDKRRVLKTGPQDPLPCGEFFDPGVKAEGRVLEKAMSRKKDLDREPPVQNLVDISRLGVVFESAEDLEKSMEWMLETLDVVWVSNKYQNPSCLGYRDMNIGVRQCVSTPGSVGHRIHISEVQLLLKDMYDIKQGKGHKAYEVIRSVLHKCGVKSRDLDKVQQLVLHLLDYTDGSITGEAAENLQYVVEKIAMSTMSESGAHLAQALIEQIERSATAAGITENEKQKLKEHSKNEAAKKKEREAQAKAAAHSEPDVEVEERRSSAENSLMLDAIAKVDRSVDLTPVLEAIAKLKKESNHAPVLAAIAQLDHSSSLQASLDEIRSYLDFTPIVEKVDHLERRLDKIHASPELVLSRIEELQHYLVPMIDTISKTWKSDLGSFKKSVNVSLSKGVDVSPVVVGLKELMEKSETMSSTLNVGMSTLRKKMAGLEEANQARSNGELLSPEMRAIAKLEATVEQMHEMQEAILGTLEKQEMAHQNRILPVAELSLWQPAAADYTVSTNMQQTTACVRNSTYRDALR